MTEQANLNPNFEAIGKSFAEQYYALFDNKDTRANISAVYHPTLSLLTFEGQQFQGVDAIMEKLKSMPVDSMMRQITTLDSQPTSDGGVLVCVVGQLKNNADGDKPMGFSQTFVLKPFNNSYFIFHEIFRLVIHNC